MTKFLIGLVCVASFGLRAFASEPAPELTGLLLKVDFQMKGSKKSFQVRNDLILSKDNNDWTPLAQSKSGVALLGKIQKPDNGVFTIQYMIVDTSTTPVTVHQMGVASQLGKTAKVSSQSDDEGITVSAVAKEIAYTAEDQGR
jgi:hypothetical protein